MSCVTILFFMLDKSSDQTSGHTCKVAASLVIADGNLFFPTGLCGYVWVNILTSSSFRSFLLLLNYKVSINLFR